MIVLTVMNVFLMQICFAVGQEVVAEHGVPGVDETRRGDLAGSLPRQTQEHFPSSRRKLVKVYTFIIFAGTCLLVV